MKNKEIATKLFKWIISFAIFAILLYRIFILVTSITVYNNNEKMVRSYEKLQSLFQEENYIFPDLSKLDSGNNKYGIIMDGSTLRAKPQTFWIEVEYPHEICNIRYQVISHLSAYDKTNLSQSEIDKSIFSEMVYQDTQVYILYTCHDSANTLKFYFTINDYHYSVEAHYDTAKHLDSPEKKILLTKTEQEEINRIIHTELERITYQMIDSSTALSKKQSTDIGKYVEFPESTKSESEIIIIPTIADIRANGYPINENGETYGPMVHEWTATPDLSLVIADNGLEGYIRNSEMDSGVTTPEEAANYRSERRVLNVYLHDGTTIIGTFTLGGD